MLKLPILLYLKSKAFIIHRHSGGRVVVFDAANHLLEANTLLLGELLDGVLERRVLVAWAEACHAASL